MRKEQSTIIAIFLSMLSAQVMQAQSTWMGKRIINTAMFLDPAETQMSGSITGLVNENTLENQYIPFSFGASQSIVSNQLEDQKAWEIVGELGSFTQFEWRVIENEQQRNLINTDYRIAFSYIRKIKALTYRIRFFHVSSHLGDDYLIRNSINQYSENKMNYEQLEFTLFKSIRKNLRIYAGAGSVVRPNSIRLPFSYHLGYDWNSNSASKKWGWTFGTMIKGFQETDFTPNLKLGIGPAYFSKSKLEPIRIVLEYYNGHLPYSQFEDQKTEWLGLGLYFYI